MEDDIEDYRVDPNDFEDNKEIKPIISGYGCVYFKIQKKTKIKCVSKMTNVCLTEESSKRSFMREVETLAHCHHPAIVPFIGFAEKDDFGYIYLVQMENGSIQSFLEKRRKGEIDPNFDNTAKYIISYGIAKSMKFLHDQDRIHRDLKPGNVLLDDNLYPLLTDFGTAKQIDHSVKINQTLESTTPTIMAPEFINDAESHSNSLPIDVYAYGMTLYELWTELVPFGHLKTAYQVFKAVSEGQRPGISDSISESWKNLIERCWSDNSESRPTFNEIVEEFDNDPSYITEDMNQAAISKYKRRLSKSLLSSLSKSSSAPIPKKVVPPKDENAENPVLKKLREEAQAGDATSQFNYVIAQFEGTYGAPNYKEAKEYAIDFFKKENTLSKENKKNVSTMIFYAGKCFAEDDKDYKMAEKYLKLSSHRGNWNASFYLAELMFNNIIEHKKLDMIRYYQIAADNGVPEAIKKYAYMLYYGTIDGRPDKTKAIQYFKQGSENGDPELMYMWATRNEYGRDIDKDTKYAMTLMKMAADKGYSTAMVDYGLHLLNGQNLTQNEKEAKNWFHAAAMKDDPWGMLWYYLMCKNDGDKSDDLEQFLIKSCESNQVPESWSVYGRTLIEQGNIGEAMNFLFAACQSGSINAYLTLAEYYEGNPTAGYDTQFYFEMASNFCHCLDSVGFTTPIPYKVFHCYDCGFDVCEGCANHCHKDHDTKEVTIQCGFKCKCGKNGFSEKCSDEFVGETNCYQHLYQCQTCCIKNDTSYICKSCAEKCHKGHKIIDCGVLRDFCSCGMHKMPYNFKCHLLKYQNDMQCCSFDQGKKIKQRWFQCIQCGLYGNEEIGICDACSKVCHDTHVLLDLGVKEKCCCCRNANCAFQDE